MNGQCERVAKLGEYCTQHHPDNVAKRDAERRKRWAEQDARIEARYEAERARAQDAKRYPELRLAAQHVVEVWDSWWARYHGRTQAVADVGAAIQNLLEVLNK